MKLFFKILFILFFSMSYVYAGEEWKIWKGKNCIAENLEVSYSCEDGGLFQTDDVDDTDPLETINRGIFWTNQGIDYILIEPIALVYIELVPEDARIRVSNILRNLTEPIVFVNNLLQGDLESGRGTVWRFIFNTIFGLAGFYDASTEMGVPYKKQDLGLTFASWGIQPGPYLVLPILGPSNMRDALGRLGDYMFDPINWFTLPLHSTARTGVQILDAKADNREIIEGIKRNAIDHYASIRSWYTERRNSLMTAVEDREAIDTARPEEDKGELDSPRPEVIE
jgi:phospholipid-binding lipoprotein MlaA